MKILKFIVGIMRTNCYFLVDEMKNECIVVDPGYDAEGILSHIRDRGLKCAEIWLTHAHFDHIMGLAELREKTGAPLRMHPADTEILLDNGKNLMRVYGGIDVPQKEAELAFEDGAEIPFAGETIKVLHTPGHTPGSVCLIFRDGILTGDTVFREGFGRTDFFGGDPDELDRSMVKIRQIEGDYRLYPGHGASTTLEHEKYNNIKLI
ncbi:MAG: MBL fold metallo-hydrolase [Lachnospiraceae bacterium]|nr:MBL fold metallo-hydrolase [Lachnospiraceae bacterium]